MDWVKVPLVHLFAFILQTVLIPFTMTRSVLISGVSTGIGYHLLQAYYRRGYKVFGSIRRESDRERLLGEFPDFVPLLFDVTDESAIREGIEVVRRHLDGKGLDLLINNAGVAVSAPLMLIDTEDFHHQFDVNLYGVLRLTKACLPLLGAVENADHPPGRILNISSISGQVAYPYLGPYVSSKHALEGLSNAWRRELYPFGIDVVIIAPGSIRTPIWKKNSSTGVPDRFRNSIFGKYLENFRTITLNTGKRGMDPDEFANKVMAISEKKRPKTRYAIVKNYFSDWILVRYLVPARVLDWGIHRQLKK